MTGERRRTCQNWVSEHRNYWIVILFLSQTILESSEYMHTHPIHTQHAFAYLLEVLWPGGSRRKWKFEASDPQNLAESTVGGTLVRVSV